MELDRLGPEGLTRRRASVSAAQRPSFRTLSRVQHGQQMRLRGRFGLLEDEEQRAAGGEIIYPGRARSAH
jgi:hypothetical protein